MLRTSYAVLSTILASAADITQSAGVLSITNCVPMKYSQIVNAGFGYVLPATEYPGSITVTPSAITAGVPNTLIIMQYVGGTVGSTVQEGQMVQVVLSYTPVTGDTATIVCNAWRAQLLLSKSLQVAGTGTGTFILTANTSTATNPYQAAIINVQSTSGTNSVALTTTVSVTSSTDATPIVVTTAASTYAVGQIISITGHTTNVAANGTFLITATNGTTTVTLGDINTGADVAGSGAGAGAGGTLSFGVFAAGTSTTNVSSGNQSRGAYWDLVSVGVDPTLLTSGKIYNQIIFTYRTTEGGDILTEAVNSQTLYVQSDATNFSAFKTRMIEITKDYSASATTADPKNLSLI